MSSPTPDPLARYQRQMLYAPLGRQGQEKLAAARVLVVGCGALGSVLANTLARAGVGRLRLIDRDFLELSNLQRQVLYDEDDVAAELPKAIAAANKLRRINSAIEIEPIVADVAAGNVLELCRDVDCIVDGTDNFEIRFLLNDVSLRENIPWVYGGCLGAEGQTMTILPGETACLRCLLRDAPPPGSTPTCDTAGILSPAINVIASLQAMEAMKIMAGRRDAVSRVLTIVNLWDNRIRQVKLDALGGGECPACTKREFPWLEGQRGSRSAVLCGRNAVQLNLSEPLRLSLEELATKLAGAGEIRRNAFLLRLTVPDYTLTLFPDGRTIINGTDDPAVARTVYARYVGS